MRTEKVDFLAIWCCFLVLDPPKGSVIMNFCGNTPKGILGVPLTPQGKPRERERLLTWFNKNTWMIAIRKTISQYWKYPGPCLRNYQEFHG